MYDYLRIEPPDLAQVNQRIKDNLQALSDFKKNRQEGRYEIFFNNVSFYYNKTKSLIIVEGIFLKCFLLLFICRSRHEYLKVLIKDLMTYYSYNEYFMEYLVDLFPGGEVN